MNFTAAQAKTRRTSFVVTHPHILPPHLRKSSPRQVHRPIPTTALPSPLPPSVAAADAPLVRVDAFPNGSFSIIPSPAAAESLKVVNVSTTKGMCNGACGQRGKWRYATRNYLCGECSHKPPHLLITRTKAKAEFGLTFDELHQAFQKKNLHMFTVPNPHNRAAPPSRLYYYHEILNLAQRLGRL
jgi:hypothetical protein